MLDCLFKMIILKMPVLSLCSSACTSVSGELPLIVVTTKKGEKKNGTYL